MGDPVSGDPRKNRLPARIGGWPGTATGGQIHVVHISHTHPPKEIIQALRKYLLGKKNRNCFCENLEFFRKKVILDRCKGVHCVDLGESFPTNIYLAKFGFDTAENEPPKV